MTSPHAAAANVRLDPDPALMTAIEENLQVTLTANHQAEPHTATSDRDDAAGINLQNDGNNANDASKMATDDNKQDVLPAEPQTETQPPRLEQDDAPGPSLQDDSHNVSAGAGEHATTQGVQNDWTFGAGSAGAAVLPDGANLDHYPQPMMFPLSAIGANDYTQMLLENAKMGLDLSPGSRSQPYLQESAFPHDTSFFHDPRAIPASLQEPDETRVKAFAKLIFDDGVVYINTYQLFLGRDLVAAREAARWDEEASQALEEQVDPQRPKTPVQVKREGSFSRPPRSVISESAGVLRDEDVSDNDYRIRRRKSRKGSKKSKSTPSSSRHPSRRNSVVQAGGSVRSTLQATREPARGDPALVEPSPFSCPTIHIHPPAALGLSGFKPISRRHIKIAYNPKNGLWEASIIGRNGAFIDDEFYLDGKTVPLKCGSLLQIGVVCVRFLLPNVAVGHNGAENAPEYDENHPLDRYSEGGKEMSFDFEDTPRDGALAQDTSEESSEGEAEGFDDQDEDQDEGEELEDDEEELETSDRSGLAIGDVDEQEDDNEEPEPETVLQPQKRKGPGRPPKNGIMSKREQQLLKKQALAQQQAASESPATTKNKVGRPRKHPRPDTPPLKTEKRKYTKRKPKEPKDATQQDGSGSDDKPKERKEKKPPKPPRSPSPVFKESDLTPEQLQKPTANYVTLIHEALTNSAAGEMSLPQIYRAIQRKYPFFVLKCSTNGWQSSVRHNLSQHHAFRKVRRDGKGWMWAVVEGVSIEKEKKRRITPPPQMAPGHMHHQPIYTGQHPAHIMPGHPAYGPGMMGPPPGYSMTPQMPPHMRPGGPLPYIPPSQINGLPLQPGIHPQMNTLAPPGLLPPTPAQVSGQNGHTYSSPYAPKPPAASPVPAVEHQPKVEPRPSSQSLPPVAVPQQPQPAAQSKPQPNQTVLSVVETFRVNLVKSLKEKTGNAEAIVASAVNRVLGVTTQSSVPGDPNEDMIINALRAMLSKIPGSNISALAPAHHPHPTGPESHSRPHTPQANQNGPTSSTARPFKASGTEKLATTVKRPSYGGQATNRPAGQSVPRPSMMGTGMKRANSGSPALPRPSTASSASPAPTPISSNGSAVLKQPTIENGPNGQIAGQKRGLDDAADEGRDFKRLETSGLAQLKT